MGRSTLEMKISDSWIIVYFLGDYEIAIYEMIKKYSTNIK